MYKTIGIASLLALALILTACGSGNSMSPGVSSINGNWIATLNNPDGSLAYKFSATLTQGSGSQLSITNLTYTTDESCTALGALNAAAGSFSITGSSHGSISGPFTMQEILTNVGGADLSLEGALSNGTISGSWNLTGLVPPCGGSGSFTMQPAPN